MGLELSLHDLARSAFDEEWYRTQYPDVAEAIASGKIGSGLAHFERYGFSEGRMPVAFDETFYLASYPLAAREIAAGDAEDPFQHYLKRGKARGYLPHHKGRRPAKTRAAPSIFGSLWTDEGNADDQIAGKLETRQIDEEEAELLRFWRKNGYVILKSGVSPEATDAAREALDKAYSGGFPGLLFECHSVAKTAIPWKQQINQFPAKALDIHMFSEAVRDAVFAPKVTRFLGLLFNSLPLASQTLGFLRGSAQPAHQDSAYVAYTMAREFAASWIALEDVTQNAGELFLYPGSDKFEEFLYADEHKSVSEAIRSGIDPKSLNPRIEEHERSLPERARQFGLERETFMAKAGDVLIWHADLAHGGAPVSKEATRKSIVTHYCPRFNVPLFLENQPEQPLFKHEGGYFVSGIYPRSEPR